MDQIEVVPNKDGTWNWRSRSGGKIVEKGKGYENRADAIAAAREGRGDATFTLTDDAGNVVGTTRASAGPRIVLLRLDGSEYGELDPPASGGTQAQLVSITPAGSTNEAVKLGG